jgi:uncharacterized protein involved in exopolysaccharide biosynthesis
VRAFRDVKVQEAMLEVMIRQFEMARIDESREGPLLQQIDVASVPEKKSAPKRSLIAVAGLMLGLMLGLGIAFARRMIKRNEDNPSAWLKLKSAWGFKKHA